MNERQTYRVMRTEAQQTVKTSAEFVAQRLTAGGWKCIGTGSALECELMVYRSTEGKRVRWIDIPSGAQCTVKA